MGLESHPASLSLDFHPQEPPCRTDPQVRACYRASFHYLAKKEPVKLTSSILISLLLACQGGRHLQKQTDLASRLQLMIDSVRQAYVTDPRTALFAIETRGEVLYGETTLPEARADLIRRLQAAGTRFTDSIVVLPQAELGNETSGLVTISVANFRSQPHHRAELTTQALMGTPVKLLKRQKGWYLAQTPDQYLAWVDGAAVQRVDSTTLLNWLHQPRFIYTRPFGFLYADSAMTTTASDLVYGDIALVKSRSSSRVELQLPDGRRGFVPLAEGMEYDSWRLSRDHKPANLVAAARLMLGLPYLWGGTSFKGVDCSGFTKTVFLMNGMVLPRDASQQARLGKRVDTSAGWSLLQPGDLLFFGSPERDGKPEMVTHVGMWIGNGEFIHSSGMVHIASLVPGRGNYDAGEHRRFLYARRIIGDSSITYLSGQKPL